MTTLRSAPVETADDVLLHGIELNRKALVCDVCGSDFLSGKVLLLCHPPEAADDDDDDDPEEHVSHSGCVSCFAARAHDRGGDCVACVSRGVFPPGRAARVKQVNGHTTTLCSYTAGTVAALDVARAASDRQAGQTRRKS